MPRTLLARPLPRIWGVVLPHRVGPPSLLPRLRVGGGCTLKQFALSAFFYFYFQFYFISLNGSSYFLIQYWIRRCQTIPVSAKIKINTWDLYLNKNSNFIFIHFYLKIESKTVTFSHFKKWFYSYFYLKNICSTINFNKINFQHIFVHNAKIYIWLKKQILLMAVFNWEEFALLDLLCMLIYLKDILKHKQKLFLWSSLFVSW